MRKWIALFFLLGIFFIFSGVLINSNSKIVSTKTTEAPPSPKVTSPSVSSPPSMLMSAQVLRVIDGDTIDVFINAKKERVRLIGMDTPEAVDHGKPIQCFGPESQDEAKKVLNGQQIRLEPDSSQGEKDKYQRSLYYIFLADGTNFNELMIRKGFAREYTYKTAYKYQKEFKLAQQEAQKEKLGLWSSCQ